MQRASALLLLAVLFLALAAQANYMQLALVEGKEPSRAVLVGSLVAYVLAFLLTALGLMRSAAGSDRYVDGQRAPPPNPKPITDYPHGYQPWLTPGLNWGY